MKDQTERMKTKHLLLFAVLSLLFTSCNTTKKVSYSSSKYKKHESSQGYSYEPSGDVKSLIKEAKKFLGTPYKYGGNSKSGLDCSGLVFNAFEAVGEQMPRISREQANKGKEIRLKDVKQGDLVFFKTSGSKINHVGIVENVRNGEVFFIHSSTSQGVIISSIEEIYWNKRFVKATRVL